MLNKTIIYILLGVFIAIGASVGVSFVIINNKQEKQLAWVELGKLIEGFDLKKQITAQMQNTALARNKILDSLELDLKLSAARIQNGSNKEQIEEFNLKRKEYLIKKEKFDEDNRLMEKTFNEQVFNQINQYVKDYGIEHSYQFIFGSSGDGSIMFAQGTNNITDELIIFINQKYKGDK